MIQVAILGSDSFDVADVDVTKLAFARGRAAPVDAAGGRRRDVNSDGFVDLVSRYRTAETGIAFGDTAACVAGELQGGVPFEACDAIRTVRAPKASAASGSRGSSSGAPKHETPASLSKTGARRTSTAGD
jgi:hypothetical protein